MSDENLDKHQSLQQVITHRLEKLNNIKSAGINPYPHSFDVKNKIKDLIVLDETYTDNISTAGRIVSMRKMGKAAFCHIQNGGKKIQLYLKDSLLETNQYDNIVRNLDIGDIVGIAGNLFCTKTKELSIRCTSITILSKSIRPLPNIKEKDGELFFNFDDKELRYRNRHLDLLINNKTKETFEKRASLISSIRDYLNKKDFLEVETPVLQSIYGGANARPFTTFHNTLEEELFLRISLELYLKRLIIGGINKVYELSKNFRNEGMDKDHNPEFTMLEFYSAYSDVYDMLALTENMIKTVFLDKLEKGFCEFDSNKILLENDFVRIDFFDSISKYSGTDVSKFDENELKEFLNKSKIKIDKDSNYGNLIDKVFSHFVESNLIQPTFVLNFPKEISPLAKSHRKNDKLVERFELFIGGMEIANSFTELNDPVDQLERLTSQSSLRDKGDLEAQPVDNSFIQAMEVGMPPTGGVGIGIDRLTMLLTNNTSIKDVILFPAMRSENE